MTPLCVSLSQHITSESGGLGEKLLNIEGLELDFLFFIKKIFCMAQVFDCILSVFLTLRPAHQQKAALRAKKTKTKRKQICWARGVSSCDGSTEIFFFRIIFFLILYLLFKLRNLNECEKEEETNLYWQAQERLIRQFAYMNESASVVTNTSRTNFLWLPIR